MQNLQNVKDFLSYNPDTGNFTWLIKRSGNRPNTFNIPAGIKKKDGGIHITYNNKHWNASHLAFYFIYGRLPEKGKVIDHINRIRDDNRIENLREVTYQENQLNRKDHNKYGAGIRYVCGTYYVRLTLNKVRKSISCMSLKEAIELRDFMVGKKDWNKIKEFLL